VGTFNKYSGEQSLAYSIRSVPTRLGCVGLILGALALSVHAQTPGPAANIAPAVAAPLPLLNYIKPSEFSNVRLSADGRYIAALAPLLGHRNLVVLDLETMKTQPVTGLTDFDVVGFRWVGSEYLVFQIGKSDSTSGSEFKDGGGLFSVKRDATDFRKLAPTYRDQFDKLGSSTLIRMEYLQRVPGSETDILVAANLRRPNEADIYRINLSNGQKELQSFSRPNRVSEWVFDAQGVPRVAVSPQHRPDALERDRAYAIMYRASAEAPWEELDRYQGDLPNWKPLAFTPDGRDLLVEAQTPGEALVTGVYRFDLTSRKLAERWAGDPRYDASAISLKHDSVSGKVVAAMIQGERMKVVSFDQAYADTQAELQAAWACPNFCV